MAPGPCEWPITYHGCPEGLPKVFEGMDEDRKTAFEEMATEYLWRWTGQRFGLCEETLRPCKRDCHEGTSTFTGLTGSGTPRNGWGPALIEGRWFNLGCGACGTSCGCSDDGSLRLPDPVESIVSVEINGETLEADTYRVDNYGLLVRTDGGRWPGCQNLNADLGETDTWAVTYKRGQAVPTGGQHAVGRLAVELALAECDPEECSLPQRVQSITRQGVTVAMLDSFDDIDKGHTGIWGIDSWISSVTKPPKSGRVLSPDYRSERGRISTFGKA